MAKYISIYFDMFYEKLVGTGVQPARSKTKIWYALHSAAFSLGECQWKKNMSHFLQVNLFQTKIFEVHFHFLLHIWVQVDCRPINQQKCKRTSTNWIRKTTGCDEYLEGQLNVAQAKTSPNIRLMKKMVKNIWKIFAPWRAGPTKKLFWTFYLGII